MDRKQLTFLGIGILILLFLYRNRIFGSQQEEVVFVPDPQQQLNQAFLVPYLDAAGTGGFNPTTVFEGATMHIDASTDVSLLFGSCNCGC